MSNPKIDKVPAQQLMSCGEVACEVLVNPIPRPELDPIRITLKPKVPRQAQGASRHLPGPQEA